MAKPKCDLVGRLLSAWVLCRAVTITPDDPLFQGEEITMLLMPMMVND